MAKTIHRQLEDSIVPLLDKGKAVVIYGARQVGKTTLAQELAKRYAHVLYKSCDKAKTAQELSNQNLDYLINLTKGYDALIIDEAQKAQNIGNTIKQLVDAKLPLQIILTGSSSLDLANTIKEPMTGRVFEFKLTPISVVELQGYQPTLLTDLSRLLILGSYPEVITSPAGEAEKIIRGITDQYTFRDILQLSEIKNIEALRRLLTALALQIGSEVSYNELSNLLDISREAVERYIWLLEQSFIIYRLDALSGNPRKLISSRKRKVYFYDLGLRNALINDFRSLAERTDVGALFENFCVNERYKHQLNQDHAVQRYYFRAAANSGEIDLVEMVGAEPKAYEFKWSAGGFRVPLEFKAKYPGVKVKLVNRDNFLGFVKS